MTEAQYEYLAALFPNVRRRDDGGWMMQYDTMPSFFAVLVEFGVVAKDGTGIYWTPVGYKAPENQQANVWVGKPAWWP